MQLSGIKPTLFNLKMFGSIKAYAMQTNNQIFYLYSNSVGVILFMNGKYFGKLQN